MRRERATRERIRRSSPLEPSGRLGRPQNLASWIFSATLWQVGQVERARQTIDSATRRASETGDGRRDG